MLTTVVIFATDPQILTIKKLVLLIFSSPEEFAELVILFNLLFVKPFLQAPPLHNFGHWFTLSD